MGQKKAFSLGQKRAEYCILMGMCCGLTVWVVLRMLKVILRVFSYFYETGAIL